MWSVIGKGGQAVERIYTVKKLSRGKKVGKKDQKVTQKARAGSQSPSQARKQAWEPSHSFDKWGPHQPIEQDSSNAKRPRKGKVIVLFLIHFDIF